MAPATVGGVRRVRHHDSRSRRPRPPRRRPRCRLPRRGCRGRRLQEHDPEPLLLQAAPAGPAAQGEHIGAGVQRRQVRRRHPAQAGGRVHRSRWMRRSSRGRSRPVPAMATTSCGWRPDPASRAAASTSVSMPLRGTRRLTLSTSGPIAGNPRRARVLARSIAGEGHEASRVHPRRDPDDRGEADGCRRPGGLPRRDRRRRR